MDRKVDDNLKKKDIESNLIKSVEHTYLQQETSGDQEVSTNENGINECFDQSLTTDSFKLIQENIPKSFVNQ